MPITAEEINSVLTLGGFVPIPRGSLVSRFHSSGAWLYDGTSTGIHTYHQNRVCCFSVSIVSKSYKGHTSLVDSRSIVVRSVPSDAPDMNTLLEFAAWLETQRGRPSSLDTWLEARDESELG